jgi:processive 1,2-diacylglycerol beta-glucosyltransferase
VKKILILTASYGEGHNSAARGIQAGLARVAPDAQVESHDLFAETYGDVNEWIRKTYLTVINNWPRSWGLVYRWLDQRGDFDRSLARFSQVKKRFASLLERFQPDIVVSVFPPYPYLLQQLSPDRKCKSVVVVTDSITVNAIWYRCTADYFLVPNEQSAAVVRAGGIAPEIIKTFGFPVNPKFADLAGKRSSLLPHARPRVLHMISGGKRQAPELVRRLADLEIDLTVTVGHDEKLRQTIESLTQNRGIEVVGWTDQLPELLSASHVLIGKAGGATVQETIAAGCPMIINHVVSGQEEGNAQLIFETGSGAIARSPADVATRVQRAFADDGRQWRDWAQNIARMSRPRASLDTAEFLLGL